MTCVSTCSHHATKFRFRGVGTRKAPLRTTLREDFPGSVVRRLRRDVYGVPEGGVVLADACAGWGLAHLVGEARTGLLDLWRAAGSCPPGELQLMVRCDGERLVVALRTPPGDGRCRRDTAPLGYRHRVTPAGHIGWLSLTTSR